MKALTIFFCIIAIAALTMIVTCPDDNTCISKAMQSETGTDLIGSLIPSAGKIAYEVRSYGIYKVVSNRFTSNDVAIGFFNQVIILQ